MLPKMSAYVKRFDKTKYVFFDKKYTRKNIVKNIIKSRITSAIALKKNLIANQCTIKNI